jgi:hypothetical protein
MWQLWHPPPPPSLLPQRAVLLVPCCLRAVPPLLLHGGRCPCLPLVSGRAARWGPCLVPCCARPCAPVPLLWVSAGVRAARQLVLAGGRGLGL